MKLCLLGYEVTITAARSRVGDPMTWSCRGQRMLAHSIAAAVNAGGMITPNGAWGELEDHKIDRIKACRTLLKLQKVQSDEFGLVEAKRFVEYAFADGGRSNQIVI